MGNIDFIVRIQFRKVGQDFLLGFADHFVPVQLVRIHQGIVDLGFPIGFDFLGQFCGGSVDFEVHFGLAHFGLDLFLEFHQFLDFAVRKPDGIQHHFFRNFLGAGFHHQDGVFGTGHCQVQFADLGLFHSGFHNELAIDEAYPDPGDGAFKGDIRNGQGTGSTDHGRNVRGIVRIHGNCRAHDLYIVVVAVREHRPNGPVDEPGREDGRFCRPPFSPQEPAGDLAHCVHLFFEIHCQREEIHPFPGGIGTRHSHHYSRFAVADQNSAIGLFGNLPRFNGKGPTSKIRAKTMHPLHPPYVSLLTLWVDYTTPAGKKL